MEDSILYPSDGEYQIFCYDIVSVGEDTAQYADLSHFLLGICNSINQEDILAVTVTVNGEPQKILWGENVEIKTSDKPDNLTGCAGLKFDFPLDKQNGRMQICGPACGGSAPCESVVYQTETVCVPVKVTPYAKPGDAKTSCVGNPVVRPGMQCSGSQTSCSFTITQELYIEIPITFGAEIETGAASVRCGTE